MIRFEKVTYKQVLTHANLFTKSWWSNAYEIKDFCRQGNCYSIFKENLFLGFVVMTVNSMRNGMLEMHIEFIEIIDKYKGKGYFRQIIEAIYQINITGKKIQVISGESVADALFIWQALGANFYMSDEKLREYYDEGYTACFRLSRKKFLKER